MINRVNVAPHEFHLHLEQKILYSDLGMPKVSRGTLNLLCLFFLKLFSSINSPLYAQGETTSAIVGQVGDQTSAAVVDAAVTVKNVENGLTRTVQTDDAGRFNFPQLKPGSYEVTVKAAGFEPQQQESVFSGLGQKQTVNFTLKLASAKQAIDVTGEAPLISVENPNTSRTLNAAALAN